MVIESLSEAVVQQLVSVAGGLAVGLVVSQVPRVLRWLCRGRPLGRLTELLLAEMRTIGEWRLVLLDSVPVSIVHTSRGLQIEPRAGLIIAGDSVVGHLLHRRERQAILHRARKLMQEIGKEVEDEKNQAASARLLGALAPQPRVTQNQQTPIPGTDLGRLSVEEISCFNATRSSKS